MATKLDEPTVERGDGAAMSYSEARSAWEAGEFSDWVEAGGFPLTIDGETWDEWPRGDQIEDALSDATWDND